MKNIHEINKKESSSFKRYANALQMEAENFVNILEVEETLIKKEMMIMYTMMT